MSEDQQTTQQRTSETNGPTTNSQWGEKEGKRVDGKKKSFSAQEKKKGQNLRKFIQKKGKTLSK